MAKRIFLRTAFNYNMFEASKEDAFVSTEPGKTVQSQKDEADINRIVRRVAVTGQMPQSATLPTYQLFANVFDFQTAQNAMLEARKSFMSVSASIRAKFGNDPQQFVEFCSKKENLGALREMGLAPPEKIVQSAEVVKKE